MILPAGGTAQGAGSSASVHRRSSTTTAETAWAVIDVRDEGATPAFPDRPGFAPPRYNARDCTPTCCAWRGGKPASWGCARTLNRQRRAVALKRLNAASNPVQTSGFPRAGDYGDRPCRILIVDTPADRQARRRRKARPLA